MCATVYGWRHLVKATEVTAGLAESNGSLLPGQCRDSLHIACGLTACTLGSAPGPTVDNEYGKTLPLHSISKLLASCDLEAATLLCGHTPQCSHIFCVLSKSVQGFQSHGGRKLVFFITLPIGFYNSLDCRPSCDCNSDAHCLSKHL